ncbi:MAG: hypothetical protein GZ090_07480 [Oxalobacteraceae bacterium]|nr:hypothetical protein [Oxalobacteraceae bacterium]
MKNIDVEIIETAEFGTVLKCSDLEAADEFEDFLTEQCFVPFKVALQAQEISFFFGQASTTEKVREVYERFSRQREITDCRIQF